MRVHLSVEEVYPYLLVNSHDDYHESDIAHEIPDSLYWELLHAETVVKQAQQAILKHLLDTKQTTYIIDRCYEEV